MQWHGPLSVFSPFFFTFCEVFLGLRRCKTIRHYTSVSRFTRPYLQIIWFPAVLQIWQSHRLYHIYCKWWSDAVETLSWVSLVWRPWEEQFFLHTVDSFRFQNKIHIKNRHISPSVQTQLAYTTLVPLVTGALLMNGGKLNWENTAYVFVWFCDAPWLRVRKCHIGDDSVGATTFSSWWGKLEKKLASSPCCFTFRHPVKLGLCQNHQSLLPGVCVCLCLCMCSVRSSLFFFLPSILSVCPSHTVIKSPSLFTHTHTHTPSLYLCSPSLPACLPLFFFFFFPASRSPCPWLYDREKCVYKTHSLTDQTTQMNQKTLARGESGRKEGRKRRRQKESRGCVEAL